MASSDEQTLTAACQLTSEQRYAAAALFSLALYRSQDVAWHASMEHTNNNNIWGIPPHIDVDLFDDEEAAHLQLTREEWEMFWGWDLIAPGGLLDHVYAHMGLNQGAGLGLKRLVKQCTPDPSLDGATSCDRPRVSYEIISAFASMLGADQMYVSQTLQREDAQRTWEQDEQAIQGEDTEEELQVDQHRSDGQIDQHTRGGESSQTTASGGVQGGASAEASPSQNQAVDHTVDRTVDQHDVDHQAALHNTETSTMNAAANHNTHTNNPPPSPSSSSSSSSLPPPLRPPSPVGGAGHAAVSAMLRAVISREQMPMTDVILKGKAGKEPKDAQRFSYLQWTEHEGVFHLKPRVHWFDARARTALKEMATWLRVDWSVLHDLENVFASTAWAPQERNALKKKKSKAFKYAAAGAAAVTGGALLAVTGGLAAPIVAGSLLAPLLSAAGVAGLATSLTAFVGTTAGTALVMTSLGAAGAGYASTRVLRRLGDVKEFGFREIPESEYVASDGPILGDNDNDNKSNDTNVNDDNKNDDDKDGDAQQDTSHEGTTMENSNIIITHTTSNNENTIAENSNNKSSNQPIQPPRRARTPASSLALKLQRMVSRGPVRGQGGAPAGQGQGGAGGVGVDDGPEGDGRWLQEGDASSDDDDDGGAQVQAGAGGGGGGTGGAGGGGGNDAGTRTTPQEYTQPLSSTDTSNSHRRRAPKPPKEAPLLPFPLTLSPTEAPRLAVSIGIHGWVRHPQDFITLWGGLQGGINQRFTLVWESTELIKLSNELRDMLASMAGQQAARWAATTFVASASVALSALFLPSLVVSAFGSVDGIWAVVMDRAQKSGVLLAHVLMSCCHGGRPVTLIGYSMGARVLYYCLQELVAYNALGIVEHAVLLGAPVDKDRTEWAKARRVVSGRLVNGYSKVDYVLGVLYRLRGLLSTPAGLVPVACPGVENINCSEYVSGHVDYIKRMDDILDLLGLDGG